MKNINSYNNIRNLQSVIDRAVSIGNEAIAMPGYNNVFTCLKPNLWCILE